MNIGFLHAQEDNSDSVAQKHDRKWLVSLEIPVNYSFNTPSEGDALETSSMPFGILFYAQSPYQIGFGLEKYYINLVDNSTGNSVDNRVSILMIDAMYTLPVPVVIIELGVGIGYAGVEGTNEGNFKTTMAYQYFFRAGIPIKDICQVYLNFHKVTAQIELQSDDFYLEAGGIMSSLGVGIKF